MRIYKANTRPQIVGQGWMVMVLRKHLVLLGGILQTYTSLLEGTKFM